MLDPLHPSGFVETGSCKGPRYVRTQPNREQAGVMLVDKYITPQLPDVPISFNLPYRNSLGCLETLSTMFDKLNDDQKRVVIMQFAELVGNKYPGVFDIKEGFMHESKIGTGVGSGKGMGMLNSGVVQGTVSDSVKVTCNYSLYREMFWIIIIVCLLAVIFLK
jgi:hypothetical protein